MVGSAATCRGLRRGDCVRTKDNVKSHTKEKVCQFYLLIFYVKERKKKESKAMVV